MASQSLEDSALPHILSALKQLQLDNAALKAAIDAVGAKVESASTSPKPRTPSNAEAVPVSRHVNEPFSSSPPTKTPTDSRPSGDASSPPARRPSLFNSRIILTTYPGQSGIDPVPLDWGAKDPRVRGPVVVSRQQSTIRRRNGNRNLLIDHKPDFTNTEPAVNIGPFFAWGGRKRIVSMDPFGHMAPWLFKDIINKQDIEIRPTIAITRAHMKLPELEESVKAGRLVPDGKICINSTGELAVTKVAVEPVWADPALTDEQTLRRALFEYTGGSYPELITRNDIKVFLPPIGGLTVYIFGDPAKMADPNVRLALRVHDECNGSDVFGSDICTCRPYLIFGVEEAVKEAQSGGSGVVIYFRKEGRALGEVTKYLVYNARKRGSDKASEYFKRTENIAGVKDMRFQALMPDILHWLGITKIDRMLSMSNMKHDAIVEQGIPIHERVPIPDELIPEDSRVEIDAKIHAGYFTTGKVMTIAELAAVQGRAWDDIDH
ncbi:MAG: hypothetical protein Q9160_003978 [Pyrenula sp. 1 TL-2023]